MTANANIAPPEIPELDSSLFVEVDLFGQEMKANPIPGFLGLSAKCGRLLFGC